MSDLGEIMRTKLKTITADESSMVAARRMRDEGIGSLLVVKNGDYVGILTETDFVRKAAAEGKNVSTLSVEELMHQPIVSIESTRTVREAMDRMGDFGVRHLVVLKAGKVAGMVSVRDILLYYKSYAKPSYSEPNITQD